MVYNANGEKQYLLFVTEHSLQFSDTSMLPLKKTLNLYKEKFAQDSEEPHFQAMYCMMTFHVISKWNTTRSCINI